MKIPARILASALLLVAAVPLARAQAPATQAASSLIGEIHATGSRHYTSAQIVAASGIKPGDRVTRDDLQHASEGLAQIGVFSKVNFSYTLKSDKVALEFQVEDAPTFPVSYDNFPWFADEEITSAVHDVEPLFDGTAPGDGTIIAAMTDVISKLLAGHKIPGTVDHQLIGEPFADGMMMQFYLQGPVLTVTAVDYGDDLAASSEKLKGLSTVLVGKPYSRFAIDLFESEQVLPLYFSTGHLEVKFGNPQVRFTGNPTLPLPGDAQLVLPISPGPVFHLTTVNWTGATILSVSALNGIFGISSGDLADGMLLQAAWLRVEDEYKHRGYLDVKLDPQPHFDDASGVVSYQVAVAEGAQYHMGELVITGLSQDSERALRNFWRIAPGGIFDGQYSDVVLAKLEKPSVEVFGTIPLHYTEFGHWLRTNPDTRVVDVLLDFK